MIVLDASAAVELLLVTPTGALVDQRIRGGSLHVPAHFDVEVAGAVRRAVIRGIISDHEGQLAIADLQSLPVRRWPISPMLDYAYALRETHSVADGLYVALAESLPASLVTCDARLSRSHGHRASIELVDR